MTWTERQRRPGNLDHTALVPTEGQVEAIYAAGIFPFGEHSVAGGVPQA